MKIKATVWIWAENLVKNGHKVFVSEYVAPPHWKCIWEKSVVSSFDYNREPGKVKKETEKLFTLDI